MSEEERPPVNLRVLQSAEESDAIKAMEELRRSIPRMVGLHQELARARWSSYRAHLDAGFTEDQALDLCRNIFDF